MESKDVEWAVGPLRARFMLRTDGQVDYDEG